MSTSRQHVIVLHGIFRSSRHMRPVEKLLREHEYEVHNLDYPSTRYAFAELVRQLEAQIAALPLGGQTVHYVGYSMGGLLVRALLARHKPEKLGCVVQLAPPNHGSEIADLLRNFWPYRALYGLAGQELGVGLPALQPCFAPIDYPLGIIAGNLSLDPFCACFLPGEHDGKVSVESTRLQGMRDHIVVRACHTFFPSSRLVHRQLLHFLAHGVFAHDAAS